MHQKQRLRKRECSMRQGMHSSSCSGDNKLANVAFAVAHDVCMCFFSYSFRKQAMQHHPDRGGNADTFKELNKAYEVLSDKQKRSIYDEHGEEGLAEGAGMSDGPTNIFDLFMGGGARRGGGGGKRKGEDVVFPLKITLEDAFNGTSKKLRLTKNVLCPDCRGKGGKDGAESTCRECRGQGVRMVIRQVGPGMIQQMQTTCSACRGSGSIIAEKDKCTTCHGEKTTKQKKTLEIFINRGAKHGEKQVFKEEADEAVSSSKTCARTFVCCRPSASRSFSICVRHFVNHYDFHFIMNRSFIFASIIKLGDFAGAPSRV